MSAIRPDLPFAPQPQPIGPSAQARAAQAAFFKAALAGAETARPQAPPAAAGGEPEQPRSPRPGSLLDIRV
ncbi:MAG: hypothetical protein V4707_08510 [Pseudomonadota bacterium]